MTDFIFQSTQLSDNKGEADIIHSELNSGE